MLPCLRIFIYKGPKTKLGSVCRADRAQSNGLLITLRPLANFHIELEQFCCSLTVCRVNDRFRILAWNGAKRSKVWNRTVTSSAHGVIRQGGNFRLCLVIPNSDPTRPDKTDQISELGTKFWPRRPQLVSGPLPYGENETQWLNAFFWVLRVAKFIFASQL